jgi:hypothetical protein
MSIEAKQKLKIRPVTISKLQGCGVSPSDVSVLLILWVRVFNVQCNLID